MKKFLIVLAGIIVILSLNKEENVVVPKESIRFRVIANSDTASDQSLKKEVVQNLTKEIKEMSFNSLTLDKSRQEIERRLPKFEEIVGLTLKNTEYKDDYSINYGLNYFPEKEYKGVIYEAGEYESVVVKIGDAKGKNFWCVLFPPLCQIDEKAENIEYTSLVKEIINKYL